MPTQSAAVMAYWRVGLQLNLIHCSILDWGLSISANDFQVNSWVLSLWGWTSSEHLALAVTIVSYTSTEQMCNGNVQLVTGQSPCTRFHQIFISSVRTFFQNQISTLRYFLLYKGIVTFYDNGNIFCLCLGRRSQPLWRRFLLVCYNPKTVFRSSFSSGSCVSNVCCNEKVALSMVFPICNTDKVLSLRHICCYCFW